ncbi:thiol-disulfide oxidoreductase DCC family protein [Flavobacterium sp.]|uniref:thiol-disulfide oxidoreductase DCC family protein n=1 Tax=Flavobacterium sp. TaxID=239 RepID=UPI0025DB00A1|nr:DCC1-like thiol-disulfide oxidoreductase family protein [Flavobacterium sp.]
MSELPKDKKIILFDGVCNLCDSSLQFVIKHDLKDIFRFVPLQSELGQKIINHIGAISIDSTILYEPEKNWYIKSDVAFKIIKEVGGPYKFLLVLSILPKSILDYVYDYIAKNRYKWFGTKECCMIPTTKLQFKFLA